MIKKEMSMLDAFIALEDLEDEEFKMPVNEGKGFKLRNPEDMEKAKEFLDEQETKEVSLEVIDIDADSLDHLKNNEEYVGQMILQCNSCKANRFINAEDLVESETDKDTYNIEDECPHCHGKGLGFHLIGQVGKVAEEEPKIENDSLTDEAKFDNDVTEEQPVEEEKPEETASQETEESEEEEYVEPEEDMMETSSEDDTEVEAEPESSNEESSEDSLTDEEEPDEEEENKYDEPLEVFEPEEEEEEKKKKAKKESLEEAIETPLENVYELFDNIIEPENIEKVFIYDLDSNNSEEEIFKGSYEDIPEQLFDAELIEFAVGSGMLIVNIDSESEIDELTRTVRSALKSFGDDFNSNISVWDQATGDEVFVGTKETVVEEFGHNAFLSFEAPEIIQLNVRNAYVFESLKTPYNEELNFANKEDKLISDILRENKLKEYKLEDNSARKYSSKEYWISESIKNKDDLDLIFREFVEGKGEKLALDFKDVTGFKQKFEECDLNEEIEINPDELAEEAKKLLDANNAFACIYGYQKNGKVYGLKEKFIICKDQEQLDDKSEIVRLRYKPTGSIRVAYSGRAFEEFDYRNRKDLSQAILECESNNIPYTIKRSVKEGYRYTLIKESPDRGFFDVVTAEPEVVETEVVDEVPAEAEQPEETTALMDPRDVELVNKLTRIAHDTAEAISDSYGVEVDERVILADMIQDLQLVSGQLSPEELEDTPINNLTREMYAAYNGFYEAMDELVSFITGQPITTTTAQKIEQAIASLDSEEFSTETIREKIQDPSFLIAMQQGQVPGITYNGNPRDIRLLNAPEETEDEEVNESLNEAKKDDELPADPDAVKTNVHATLNNLVTDEIEAINGYEEAKAEIADTHIEHKDEIIDTLDHIEDEEEEHIDELIAAAGEIPFEKEPEEVKLEQEERMADEANKEIQSHIEQDMENAEELDELEEPVEESLEESVDIHIEGNDVTIADNSGEDVAIIPIEPEAEEQAASEEAPTEVELEVKEEPVEESLNEDFNDWKELKTFEDVAEFGKGSKWCVSPDFYPDAENFFNFYTKNGDVFVGKGEGNNRVLALKKPDGTIFNAFDINDRPVSIDESVFENFINEWLDKNVEDTRLFEAEEGFIKEDGTIILEGVMHLEDNKNESVSFTLTPNKELNEELLDSKKVTTYTVTSTSLPESLVLNESPFTWWNSIVPFHSEEEAKAFMNKYVKKDHSEWTSINKSKNNDGEDLFVVYFNVFDLIDDTSKEALDLVKRINWGEEAAA